MQKFLGAFVVSLLCHFALGAAADECDVGGASIGKSITVDRTIIEKCMSEGKDPPKDWIKQQGVGSDIGGHENGVGPIVPVAQKPSSGAVPYYETTGCGYHSSNTKPGGMSEGGAIDACSASGSGEDLADLPVSLPFLPTIPSLNFMQCLTGLSANISANASSGCASAALHVCGMGAGGRLCTRANSTVANSGGTPITLGANGNYNVHDINLSGDDSTAIRTPVTVTAATTMKLVTSGRTVNIPAGSTIITNIGSGSEDVYDSGNNLIASYRETRGASLNAPANGSILVQADTANSPYMETIIGNNQIDASKDRISADASNALNTNVSCAGSGSCGGS